MCYIVKLVVAKAERRGDMHKVYLSHASMSNAERGIACFRILPVPLQVT